MTTTIFRKYNNSATMASDSRVSMMDVENNVPIRLIDCPKLLKTLTLDGVMYGFSGTNAVFNIFLQKYTTKEESEDLLDSIVLFAKENRLHIFIIRYDYTELKLFAYSKNENTGAEVFRISADPALDKNIYAIGSGKYSKAYKQNRVNKHAQLPINRIIGANNEGLRKVGMLQLCSGKSSRLLTIEDAKRAAIACQKKGGDIHTGGEVKMNKGITTEQLSEQIAIHSNLNKEAKASGAVCASPIYTDYEVKQLKALGQDPVTSNKIEMTEKRKAQLKSMQELLDESL